MRLKLVQARLQSKKDILAIVGLFLFSMTSASAFAEAKIGVVDAARAILQSEVGKNALGQINAEFVDEEEALKGMQKDLTGLLEKMKKDTELMSDQEFQGLFREIENKRAEIVNLGQNVQRVQLEQRERLVNLLSPQFRQAIEALVLSDDYDIILQKQSTYYSADVYDVTAKITEKLNALEK